MNYNEQLKSPMWQEKRFEILRRDGFMCRHCDLEDAPDNLIVHHITYLKSKKAWQYTEYYLITLCRKCHNLEHKRGATQNIKEIMKMIIKNLSDKKEAQKEMFDSLTFDDEDLLIE